MYNGILTSEVFKNPEGMVFNTSRNIDALISVITR